MYAEEQRAKTIQALFALTGCDFTSFFSGLGKVTFFNTFMKNARFIVGTDSLPGDLMENVSTTEDFGFYEIGWLCILQQASFCVWRNTNTLFTLLFTTTMWHHGV
jgi:hypothetical protein